jgi:hypothetical protein
MSQRSSYGYAAIIGMAFAVIVGPVLAAGPVEIAPNPPEEPVVTSPQVKPCRDGSVPVFEGSSDCIIDPLAIPKFVTPLVIPPLMHDDGTADSYDIAVRQFRQQILPGGHWNYITGRQDRFPSTTVWS